MDVLTIIQVDIVMCFILIGLLVCSHFKVGTYKKSGRIFMLLESSVLLILILEIISVVINSGFNQSMVNKSEFVIINKIVNAAGFALVPVIPYIFIMFLCRWTIISCHKVIDALCLIALFVNAALSVLSIEYNIYFNISDANLYSRGELFVVSPLISYIVMSLVGCIIVPMRKRITREELFFFSMAILLPAVLGIIQLVFYVHLTIWASWALSLLWLFIFILTQYSERDELTRLGNRRVYARMIQKAKKKRTSKMSLISIDIDGLKKINDMHGHSEGDNVLTLFANHLRSAFPDSCEIVRLGGDEFAVIYFDKEIRLLRERINVLRTALDMYNQCSANKYEISFCFGIATIEEGETVDGLMKRCDTLMYQRKKRKMLNEDI